MCSCVCARVSSCFAAVFGTHEQNEIFRWHSAAAHLLGVLVQISLLILFYSVWLKQRLCTGHVFLHDCGCTDRSRGCSPQAESTLCIIHQPRSASLPHFLLPSCLKVAAREIQIKGCFSPRLANDGTLCNALRIKYVSCTTVAVWCYWKQLNITKGLHTSGCHRQLVVYSGYLFTKRSGSYGLCPVIFSLACQLQFKPRIEFCDECCMRRVVSRNTFSGHGEHSSQMSWNSLQVFPSNRMPPAADVTDVEESKAEITRRIISVLIW